jgi:hypothetical protein
MIFCAHRKINRVVSDFVVADAIEPAQTGELNPIARRSATTDGLHNG